MDNNNLIEHLIEIKESQARTEAQLSSMNTTLERHIEEDRRLANSVDDLKKDQNRVKGALALASTLGLGGLVAAVRAWFSSSS